MIIRYVIPIIDPANLAPTVATPAAVAVIPVTGVSVSASVLGADDGGETNLVYTWSATGPADVVFSPNASNPAKDTLATFTQSGDYTFTAVIYDVQGLAATSTVAVTVAATATHVAVSPASVSLDPMDTVPFAAVASDQFDAPLEPQPAFAWSAAGISITADGLATADGDAGASYTVTATAGTVFGSAILQINGAPTLPAPVITPAGGTFSQPQTVTITPAVFAPLTNTPGWRTGVKYPELGIESVEALSQDGTTVAAMRGMTMAKSSYLFPSANLSPDSGAFPFFIWSLADLNGPANQYMIYRPSLYAGVTDNTAWDGNNGDFYYGDTGNRVYLMLQQHYTKSISLWSCAAGLNQGTVGGQKLAEFPFTAVSSLAGQATQIEFAGEQVRVRIGASPLVSATTDANGWVTYTGTNGSGRVTAPLGETRFWFTLAGGEKPGKRELVVSDTPKTTTRFTFDGSPVTEISRAVTGPLTLTHDATLRARVYGAAADRSPETVATFTSMIPQIPAWSYVSPAYLEILHATLDGSPALVSLTGPSGTTNAVALGNLRFEMRYPLLETEPTPVTLHRSGTPDLDTTILWREIDLSWGAEYPDDLAIRLGDALLLTAGSGQTGTLHIAVLNASNDVTHVCEGVAGDTFPVRIDHPGTFTIQASIDGISAGSLVVHVVYVDFHGPVACQVGCTREKDVVVYGPKEGVFFTAKDSTMLTVSVKATTDRGVRLSLKALKRGTPVVQARLGSATGPVLAEQEVDEFTLESDATVGLLAVGSSGTTQLRMRPYIPGVQFDFSMFAHYSTFYGGVTAFRVNTSDETATTGESGFRSVYDTGTGEDIGVLDFEIEISPGDNAYCFDIVATQADAAAPERNPKVGLKIQNNSCVCKIKGFNSLRFMKSMSDETPSDESPDANKDETWSVRTGKFTMEGDNDCDPKPEYKVKLNLRGDPPEDVGVVSPTDDTISAKFTSPSSDTSAEKECTNGCDVVFDYKTGIQYGIYDKEILEGSNSEYANPDAEEKNSGILAVARLDANGPEADTKDEFPSAVGMLKKRSGILYNSDGVLVGEPVIVVVNGGETWDAGSGLDATGKGSPSPSFYGVMCGARTWTFKAKADVPQAISAKVTRKWSVDAASDTSTNETFVFTAPQKGRYVVKLEYFTNSAASGVPIATAEIHSLVVEDKHSDNVEGRPALVDEDQRVGSAFEIIGKCHDDVPVDAALFVRRSTGGARGRVSLDGYPQNEYWGGEGDDKDLAQVLQLSHNAATTVYLQGYEKESDSADDKATLCVDGQAFLEQCDAETCGQGVNQVEEQFKNEPVKWQWERADEEKFVVPKVRFADTWTFIWDVVDENAKPEPVIPAYPPHVDEGLFKVVVAPAVDGNAKLMYRRGSGQLTDIGWAGTAPDLKFSNGDLNYELILLEDTGGTPTAETAAGNVVKVRNMENGDQFVVAYDQFPDVMATARVVKNFSWADHQGLGLPGLHYGTELASAPQSLRNNVINTLKYCLSQAANSEQSQERDAIETYMATVYTGPAPLLAVLDIPSARGIGVFPEDLFHLHITFSGSTPQSVQQAISTYDQAIANQKTALGITETTRYLEAADREKFWQLYTATAGDLVALLTAVAQEPSVLIYHSYEFTLGKDYQDPAEQMRIRAGDPIRNIRTYAADNDPNLIYPGNPDDANAVYNFLNLSHAVQLSFIVMEDGRILLFYSNRDMTKALQLREAFNE